MDPLDNPFAPGAGIRPPELAGRSEEIDRIALLLARLSAGRSARGLVITGLRGVGKTVLLNEFESMAEQASWGCAFKEIPAERPVAFRSVMAELSRTALNQIARRSGIAGEVRGVLEALRLLRPKISTSVDPATGAITFNATLERAETTDPTTTAEDLAGLLLELGKVAKSHSKGVLFLLDEVQNLPVTDLEALVRAMHRVGQKGVPVSIVAAGLPTLPVLAAEAASYAERLFEYRAIGRLGHEAATCALTVPTAGRLTWHPEALEAVLSATDGYPYFLQEWGRQVWNVAAGPQISTADVSAAQVSVLRELDPGFFAVRLGRASPAEQVYLRAMAALGVPCRRSALTKRLGSRVKGEPELRDRLIRKGLIWVPARGELDFTVPHFADFLSRHKA